MMDIAEKYGKATIHYNHECQNVDLTNGIAFLKNSLTGENIEVKADLIFAVDGAFSAVRFNSMQKLNRFNYSQNYIADGYRELLLPANEDGSYKLDKNALHIWPRGRFMMIALANEDGSFTCTLFMPHEGDKFAFDKLWEVSDEYTSEGEKHRMVFDIKVENGDLISEDYVLCNKWKSLGYKVWLDPTITCNHIGIKKFKGNFKKFIDKNGYV
jgi:kynurenine 3-monooxygenase